MFLSALCLAHCFALPLLVAALPLVGATFLSDQAFHWLLLGAALPVSLLALVGGRGHVRGRAIGAIGAVGIAVLITAAIIGHQILGETGEKLATATGAVTVGIAHWMNFRWHRRQRHRQTAT